MAEGRMVVATALLGFTLAAFGLALVLPWASGAGFEAGFWGVGPAEAASAGSAPEGLLTGVGVPLVLLGLGTCIAALLLAATGRRRASAAAMAAATLLLAGGVLAFTTGLEARLAPEGGRASDFAWGPSFFLAVAGLLSIGGATVLAFLPDEALAARPE